MLNDITYEAENRVFENKADDYSRWLRNFLREMEEECDETKTVVASLLLNDRSYSVSWIQHPRGSELFAFSGFDEEGRDCKILTHYKDVKVILSYQDKKEGEERGHFGFKHPPL